MMRLIIELNDDVHGQVDAALSAIKNGIQPGDLWGVGLANLKVYGVKHNKASIRVYSNGGKL